MHVGKIHSVLWCVKLDKNCMRGPHQVHLLGCNTYWLRILARYRVYDLFQLIYARHAGYAQ